MRRPRDPRAGFTTVEVLVALAILALVAGAVSSFMRAPPPSVRVMAEARQVAAVMQKLRAEAISGQAEQRFVVDVARRIYGVPGGRMVQIPDDMAISAELAAAAGGQGVVRFFPTGAASGAAIRLTSGGVSASVLVNWATGAVRVEGPAS